MDNKISRRKWLGSSCLAIGALMSGYGFKPEQAPDLSNTHSNALEELPFRISLNTSTIRAYNLTVEEQIDLVAEAGFDGIELWVNDVNNYINQGGTYEILSEKLKAKNMVLENMIGFSQWASDNENNRNQAKERLENDMLMAAKLGSKYIAAPVQGLQSFDMAKLDEYAQRYLEILEISDRTGVVPIMELWGQGPLSKVGDGANIVITTGHPKATMLLDFFHLYRGGNSWETLDYINCSKLPVIHINDYPDTPPREQLRDSDRIFPGDGICPFNEIIPKLYKAGFRGGFSVELFNQNYWDTMDVKSILLTSYEKTLQVIKESMSQI